MRIGIVCYPTVGGSGAVAAELGKQDDDGEAVDEALEEQRHQVTTPR